MPLQYAPYPFYMTHRAWEDVECSYWDTRFDSAHALPRRQRYIIAQAPVLVDRGRQRPPVTRKSPSPPPRGFRFETITWLEEVAIAV